jgi:ADP-heptose:LPS heptosyltransferase
MGEASVPQGALNLLGKTNLSEVATILCMGQLLIGNDSGLFHLAQGLGCPALGIFGPTSPDVTGIFRSAAGKVLKATLPCMPCHQRQCMTAPIDDLRRPFCMSAITVDQVLAELPSLLSQ